MDESLLTPKEDFRRARQQAALQTILARLTGQSAELLSYEEVRRKIHAFATGIPLGVRDIPLDAIIGSAGRYTDFTRSFLPLHSSDQDRWARVMSAVTNPAGLAPIDVCQLGSAFFVLDGHHRVSVARQLGATHIQAYVTEVPTSIPITPDTRPEDLLLMSEYAAFLERTSLKALRPSADVRVTELGRYSALWEHIETHRYFMGIDEQRDVSFNDAVAHWYDAVYSPVVEAIRSKGILRDFPGRTEADLYLWVSEHRTDLEQGLSGTLSATAAAEDLAEKQSPRLERVAARIGRSLADAIIPDSLAEGEPTGRWRKERSSQSTSDKLFRDILVPLRGDDPGWAGLEQALTFARREGANIQAMHVLPEGADAQAESIQQLSAMFATRCAEAGIAGNLVLESGDITRHILERAVLADIVIVALSHPPARPALQRLGAGFHSLIHRCARPILAVPGAPTPMDRILLAYDGSPKGREALFVAAYLCERWEVSLSVVMVAEDARADFAPLAFADSYLKERGLMASILRETGSVAEAILRSAEKENSQLLVMGGYGNSPMLEAVLGSDVDAVLRASQVPILICR
jgi:nucleotide-binding universal stress UspA family protein